MRHGTGRGARLVHGRGFCGTERDGGHGWYTGGASEVRNWMEGTVGTREGLLRYGKGWRARLVHHNGYWCTKCTERRIYTQDEATPKPTQMRPACGGKGEGRKGEKEKRRKGRRRKGWKGRRKKGLRDQYCRGPKMEVPMRTMVAPWRMARGQSWDIPMESSVKSVSWG